MMIDTIALSVCVVLMLGISISTIIAFLDFLHVDLLEDCVSIIRNIERRNGQDVAYAIFNKRRKGYTAVKLNFVVAIFYALPIFALLVAMNSLANLMINKPGEYPEYLSELALIYCSEVNVDGPSAESARIIGSCSEDGTEFDISTGAKSTVFYSLLVSTALSALLFINLFFRIVRRCFLIFTISAASHAEYLDWRIWIDRFNTVATFSQATVLVFF